MIEPRIGASSPSRLASAPDEDRAGHDRFHSSYTVRMCGRYRLARKKEILAEVFDVADDDDKGPRYNIAPSQSVPVVRQDATRPVRSFSLIRWGLIPFWARDAKGAYKMINARAETIAEKPAFREPLLSRRCLIPADGFYEWSKYSKEKFPFCFTLADESVFAFAGIWDRWKNPDEEWIETCSIITTSANTLLSGIHDRMPVILKPESYDLWLDPGFKKTDDLLDLLKPFPADAMRHHRVSTRVNSVKNDDPACAEEYVPTLLF
jgi:putative SOS response-associated peptidase YedK